MERAYSCHSKYSGGYDLSLVLLQIISKSSCYVLSLKESEETKNRVTEIFESKETLTQRKDLFHVLCPLSLVDRSKVQPSSLTILLARLLHLITALHNFLSLWSLNIFWHFTRPVLWTLCHSHKVVIVKSLPPSCPPAFNISREFQILQAPYPQCPRNFHCVFIILSISVLLILICFFSFLAAFNVLYMVFNFRTTSIEDYFSLAKNLSSTHCLFNRIESVKSSLFFYLFCSTSPFFFRINGSLMFYCVTISVFCHNIT